MTSEETSISFYKILLFLEAVKEPVGTTAIRVFTGAEFSQINKQLNTKKSNTLGNLDLIKKVLVFESGRAHKKTKNRYYKYLYQLNPEYNEAMLKYHLEIAGGKCSKNFMNALKKIRIHHSLMLDE